MKQNHRYCLCQPCLERAKAKGIIIKSKQIRTRDWDPDLCCISCLNNDPYSVRMFDVEATDILEEED